MYVYRGSPTIAVRISIECAQKYFKRFRTHIQRAERRREVVGVGGDYSFKLTTVVNLAETSYTLLGEAFLHSLHVEKGYKKRMY